MRKGVNKGELQSNLDAKGFQIVNLDVSNLNLAGSVNLTLKEDKANKGIANGYAPLNSASLVPTGNLGTSGSGTGTNFLADDGVFRSVAAGSVTFGSQAANLVFSGPVSGGATTPAFRALVTADMPSSVVLNTTTITEGAGLAGNVYDLSANRTLAMGLPTGLSVSSGTTVSGTTHSHAVASLSNPGAQASLLSTNSSGQLTLVDLLANGSTFNLVNSTATTVNLAGAATTLNMGASTNAIATINSDIAYLSGTLLGPTTYGNRTNLGLITKKFKALYAGELWVETLVAQDTIATIGGRILVGPTTSLIKDISLVDTTIDVKHNNLSVGDRTYMESGGKVEFFSIASIATALNPGFRYTVNRSISASPPGSDNRLWYIGDAMFNTGGVGTGFIDLYSLKSARSPTTEFGPTIVGNVRDTLIYNEWTPRWAVGNLYGLYGIAGQSIYGAGFGQYNVNGQSWVTIDTLRGVRMGSNASTKILLNLDGSGYLANSLISWDTGGNLAVTGNATIAGWTINSSSISSGGIALVSSATAASNKIYVGTGTYGNTNTAFYVDGAGKFSLKDKLTWDGTTLNVVGGGTFSGALSAATGTFSGSLSAATGTFAGSLSAATGTFSGSLSAATGTFAGSLSAATGSFSGSVTATSGSIGGWTLGASVLSGTNVTLDSSSGIKITAASGYEDARSFTFLNGASVAGQLALKYSVSTTSMESRSLLTSGQTYSVNQITAYNSGTATNGTHLFVTQEASQSSAGIYPDAGTFLGFAVGGQSPSAMLDVYGNANIRGTVTATGSTALILQSSGGVSTITESYGMHLNGDATHPVSVNNCALLVGYSQSGGSYTSGNLYVSGGGGFGVTTDPGAGGVDAYKGYFTRAGQNTVNTGHIFNIDWNSAADLWIDGTKVVTGISSDERYKQAVTSMADGALDRLAQLRPVTFRWKDTGIMNDDGNTRAGFVAQEVKVVIPEAVPSDEEPNNIIAIEPMAVVATLTKAMQEMAIKIEAMQNEIQALKK